MATFANYEVVQELYRGPVGAVVRARLPGQPGERAIKIFDPAMMGLLEADAATQSFLDRAALQKMLADRGAKHWAPVYELRATDEGAYYVADYYPLTVQKLAADRVAVDAKALHALIAGVVKGLLELQLRHRRAHGHLKAGNVLLAGSADDLANAQVLLADPAIEADSPDDWAGDLTAVGDLIHQLVLHRPFRVAAKPDEPVWPISPSPEWAALGRDGERWRELCNWLLAPNPTERPANLEAVVAVLRELTPRGGRRASKLPKPSKRTVLAVMAVPVILLGMLAAGAVVASHLNATARAELAAQDGQWFAAFVQALNDPARREAYKADPDLKAVVEEVEGIERTEPASAAADAPTTSPADGAAGSAGSAGSGGSKLKQFARQLSWSDYRRTRAALDRMRRIRQRLAPDRWKRLGDMVALQQRYEARRWDQPATFVAQLVKGTQPAPGADVAAGIDRFLSVRPKIESGAADAEKVWQRLDADARVLEKTDDKVLVAFARYFRNAAAVLVHFTDNGVEGVNDLVKDTLPLADKVVAVVQSSPNGWPDGFARAEIAQRVESALNTVQPKDHDIRAWVDAAPEYALAPLGDGSPLIGGLREALAKLVEKMPTQGYGQDQLAKFEADRQELEREIQALRDTRFTKKEVALAATGQGDVEARRAALRQELERARGKWVTQEDPREWVASIDPLLERGIRSEQVRNRWKAWTDWLNTRKDAMVANQGLFKATKEATENVKTALLDLDKNFPDVPEGLPTAFSDAAWRKREQELANLTAWAAPPAAPGDALPVPPPKERVDATRADFVQWTTKLGLLAKDFPLKAQVLTPEDRPDLKWQKNDANFWNDPIVQGLVAADVRRLNNLAKAADPDTPREAVVQLASTSDVPEIALAAWRRLGRTGGGGVATPWPRTAGELDAELDIRRRLTAMLAGFKDAALRQRVEAELKAEGPRRWRAFAGTDNPDALSAAWSRRAAFGVDERELMLLPPEARFNLALNAARTAIHDANDAAARAAAAELRDAAVVLGNQKDLADLPARLAHLGDPEPMADRMARWLAAGKSPEQFELPVGKGGAAYNITFLRVTPPASEQTRERMRPFYLATTEVSIRAFVDLVEEGSWVDAHALLGTYAGGGRPTARRYGPRAWFAPSASRPIERFDTWRFDDTAAGGFRYADELILRQESGSAFNHSSLDPAHGGNPTLDHPMQQVPAQAAIYAAALARCRLPTGREWKAAYDAMNQAGKKDSRPNLRDETWLTQEAWRRKTAQDRQDPVAAAAAASQWPDAAMSGVFRPPSLPAGASAADIWSVNGGPYPDGVLFFRPVASGEGMFRNLVGNVAEFTCETPEPLEALAADPRKLSALTVASVAQSLAGRIGVIGGSALSAPQPSGKLGSTPDPAGAPDIPYADVGFRLAFTAPAASLAERLGWVLNDQSYLPVNMVAAR